MRPDGCTLYALNLAGKTGGIAYAALHARQMAAACGGATMRRHARIRGVCIERGRQTYSVRPLDEGHMWLGARRAIDGWLKAATATGIQAGHREGNRKCRREDSNLHDLTVTTS
jgi:hypothetical protein